MVEKGKFKFNRTLISARGLDLDLAGKRFSVEALVNEIILLRNEVDELKSASKVVPE